MNVVLAVRRFVSVEPSREFRCFLLDGRLVAACQRRVDTVFRDLSDESTLSDMRARLRAFFDRALRLPTHCVVDVVIERRSTSPGGRERRGAAHDPFTVRVGGRPRAPAV